jgi:hypothetical protein
MMTKTDGAPAPATSGVLLAGGLARRMGGGDKPRRLIFCTVADTFYDN